MKFFKFLFILFIYIFIIKIFMIFFRYVGKVLGIEKILKHFWKK